MDFLILLLCYTPTLCLLLHQQLLILKLPLQNCLFLLTSSVLNISFKLANAPSNLSLCLTRYWEVKPIWHLSTPSVTLPMLSLQSLHWIQMREYIMVCNKCGKSKMRSNNDLGWWHSTRHDCSCSNDINDNNNNNIKQNDNHAQQEKFSLATFTNAWQEQKFACPLHGCHLCMRHNLSYVFCINGRDNIKQTAITLNQKINCCTFCKGMATSMFKTELQMSCSLYEIP